METNYISPFIFAAIGIIAYILTKIYCYIKDVFTRLNNIYNLHYLLRRLNDKLFVHKAKKIYSIYYDYFKTIYNSHEAKLQASLEIADLAKKNKINKAYRLIEEFKL